MSELSPPTFRTQHVPYLTPRKASIGFLQRAKDERRIAIEDFRDAFGVTHEAAALRFTHRATSRCPALNCCRAPDDGMARTVRPGGASRP